MEQGGRREKGCVPAGRRVRAQNPLPHHPRASEAGGRQRRAGPGGLAPQRRPGQSLPGRGRGILQAAAGTPQTVLPEAG